MKKQEQKIERGHQVLAEVHRQEASMMAVRRSYYLTIHVKAKAPRIDKNSNNKNKKPENCWLLEITDVEYVCRCQSIHYINISS